MLPELWQKEIVNVNKNVDWLKETAKQLHKDFGMLGIALDEAHLNTDSYSNLFQEAQTELESLYKNNYQVFQNLLYRIDLPETLAADILNKGDFDTAFKNLTEMILRREFLKVVYKYKFSG